jgi:hypothetical protein
MFCPMSVPSSTLIAPKRVVVKRVAVPFVVVRHAAGAALHHRQAGLGAVECLDLRLLLDKQHPGMGLRINMQAGDIRECLGEGRVVRQLELPPTVLRQAAFEIFCNARCRNAGQLRHRAHRPVGRLEWRRLLRQADINPAPVLHLALEFTLVLPGPLDQNPYAPSRSPMERIRHGCFMGVDPASQQWATMSS